MLGRMKADKARVGVLLCGSGYKDGSEIREAVAVLWALSASGAEVRCFAPDAPQTDVVNCLTGDATPNESRNMLVEAARIARGQIEPLSRFDAADVDALILPGGFGAAKNLCDFAFKGSNGQVRPDVRAALESIAKARKPIGAVCIAPALLALTFKGQGLKLTLGAAGEAAQELEKLGHRHEVCEPQACVVDEVHRVVSSPAYMYDDAPLHLIFEGIRKLVAETLRLARR